MFSFVKNLDEIAVRNYNIPFSVWDSLSGLGGGQQTAESLSLISDLTCWIQFKFASPDLFGQM